MTEPMRLRAQVANGTATVRILMNHEMENGQRKDPSGKLIPAWHITDVSVSHNGKPVLSAEWGPGVSKNPFLQFALKGVRIGDKISATWKDNRGESRTDETAAI